jgi:hypothetical protein
MSHRIKDWRDRKVSLGGKSLTVMLEPTTVILLEDLKERYGESNAKLIARALECLSKSFTCKQTDGSELFTCKRPENLFEAPSSEIHPSLKDIREEIRQGATVLSLKEKIKKAMRIMKSEGCDSSRIVDLLCEARIQTIKGNERWEAGTVRKWWK